MRKRSPSRDYFCLAFVAALAYFESFAHISLFHACQVVTFTKRIKIYVWFWIFLDQICPKWIKMDPTWSNLIKLYEIGFLTNQKMLLQRVASFTIRITTAVLSGFFWIRSVQSWSKLIKLDQTWSKLDFSPIKKCYYKKLSHLQKG